MQATAHATVRRLGRTEKTLGAFSEFISSRRLVDWECLSTFTTDVGCTDRAIRHHKTGRVVASLRWYDRYIRRVLPITWASVSNCCYRVWCSQQRCREKVWSWSLVSISGRVQGAGLLLQLHRLPVEIPRYSIRTEIINGREEELCSCTQLNFVRHRASSVLRARKLPDRKGKS